MPHAEMLIAGHFIGGSCDQATPKAVLKNPWNGSVAGTAAEGGANEAEAAIAAAAESFEQWRRSDPEIRKALLERIAAAVRTRRQELAELLVDEIGKPVTWALAEVDRMAVTFDLSARAALELGPFVHDLGYDRRGKDYRASWLRAPLGPVLCITPWNWPFNLGAHKLGPALAAGNTAVLKPSSLSPVSTLTLARLIHECGCPPGVLNAINVSGKVAERAAQDSRIVKVSFTGSPEVGWRLKDLLTRKRVTLELGGDASAIVLNDADPVWAAERIAASAYGYAGQVCISAQHAWAEERVYGHFRDELIRATRECPTGDPRNPETVCGPLIGPEEADRVESWIEEALSNGAKALVRGKREGNTIWPTLLEDVAGHVKLACQEVFGPVLTLGRVRDLSEAVGRTNASNYGIHASVFTRDELLATRAERGLEVAGVVVNDYPTLRFDGLPYGGVKESGFGREGVSFAIAEMTELKSLTRRI
jgi:acyl-CoA reductase-like NAD-dependent aldehyde dehydrogenase